MTVSLITGVLDTTIESDADAVFSSSMTFWNYTIWKETKSMVSELQRQEVEQESELSWKDRIPDTT